MLARRKLFITTKSKRPMAAAFLAAVLMLTTALPSPAWQEPTADNGTKAVELTVYNQDMALVKETRPLTLTLGLNEIRYADVPALIDPTSVRFSSRTSPAGTRVLEQNYEYDLVGADKLLEKYLDQPIEIIAKDGTSYKGKLLNGSGDVILMADDGQVTVLRREEIRTFCLLYTSPSPRDRTRSRMPSSA